MTAQEFFEKAEQLKRDGDLPGALDAYRQCLKINPKAAAAWVGLADVLDHNQQPGDALECLRRGAIAQPNNPIVLGRLARAYQGLGRIEEARELYNRVLQLKPGHVETLFGLGSLNEEAGDPHEAAACYRLVLKTEPSHAEALGAVMGLGKNVDVAVEIDAAKAAMADAGPREKALIGYGLGRALEQLGQFDAAFETLAAANAARACQAGTFSRDTFDRRLARMIEIFSCDFFQDRKNWGDPSSVPVFVVGMPRSGTTLTEQIIGSHPRCFGGGELAILTDLATGTPDRLGSDERAWPECAPDLSKDQIKALGSDYVDQVTALALGNATRIIDKQPLNFWHLGLVALALPNAKIIQCQRDIRDNGLSIFAQSFNLQQRWATDLGDIAYYWKGYRKLMAHWREVTTLNIHNVVYEYTVSDLEGQARQILSFLDLPWDDRVLEFHKNERAVQTPSKWQVRQPIYKTSKAKWRRYEKHLGPLKEAANGSIDVNPVTGHVTRKRGA